MVNRYIYRAFLKDFDGLTETKPDAFQAKKQEELICALTQKKALWEELVQQGELLTLSVFQYGRNLFLYYETLDSALKVEILTQGLEAALADCPDTYRDRYWLPMMDIFHYQAPQSLDHWQRKPGEGIIKSVGRVNRLRPELYSSYIYYHYQYQEEYPGDGNKYGIIGVHQDMMFFYTEEPEIKEQAPYNGLLDTKLTPKAQWSELMHQHFLPWQHTENAWLPVELLVRVG